MKRRAGAALVFVVLGVSLARKIGEYDVWFYLSVGRVVFSEWRLPREELFVTPLLGEPGAYHEWGFGLLYYAAYHLAGLSGLCAANALLCLCLLGLLHAAASSDSHPAALLAICATLAWTYYRFDYRAELILYLAVAGVVLLCERFLRTGKWRFLMPLPAIAFFHVQCHLTVLLPIFVFACYGLQATMEKTRQRSLLLAGLLSAAVAMLVAASMNPYGSEQIAAPIRLYQSPSAIQDVVEFLPTLSTPQRWPFLTLLLALALAMALGGQRRLVDAVLIVSFGIMAYRYARNVALLAAVAHVPIARFAVQMGEALEQRLPRARRLLWLLVVASLGATLARPFRLHTWGRGLVEDAFPVRSVRLLQHLQPQGTIFNFYHLGSYLSFNLAGRYTVFIDGRHLERDRSMVLHDRVLTGDPEWERILEEHRARIILTPPTLPYSGRLVPLVPLLVGHPAWELLEVEPAALTFVRRDAVASAIPALPKSRVWEEVIREATSVIDEYPDHADAYLALARAHMARADLAATIAAYRGYVALRPEDSKAADELVVLESIRKGQSQ